MPLAEVDRDGLFDRQTEQVAALARAQSRRDDRLEIRLGAGCDPLGHDRRMRAFEAAEQPAIPMSVDTGCSNFRRRVRSTHIALAWQRSTPCRFAAVTADDDEFVAKRQRRADALYNRIA